MSANEVSPTGVSSCGFSLWRCSIKTLVAALLLLAACFYSSQTPVQAGLLSYLFHKKNHQTEATSVTTESSQKQDSGSTGQPFCTQQSGPPTTASPYCRQTTVSPNNGFRQNGANFSSSINNPARATSRGSFWAQPSNRTCLGGVKPVIRVAIALNVPSFELVTPDGAQVINAASGQTVASLPPQSRWSLQGSNQALILQRTQQTQIALARWARDNSPTWQSTLKPVAYYQPTAPNLEAYNRSSGNNILSLPMASFGSQIGYFVKPLNSSNQDGLVGLGGKFFRGSLSIQLANSAGTLFNVINHLPVEDYLLSVVPSEMPSAWPLEALKAQAIAARSYAYANLGKHGSDGYDLKDNIEDQAYSGVKSEFDSTNLAVASTNSLVLKYDGKPICAYFHSTSGGSTELSENVWSRPLPYLKAVADYDDLSPHFSWSKKFSIEEVEGKLAPGLGPVLTVFVVSRSGSQRVSNLLVVGKADAKLMSGESVRRQLKLPSTNFNVFSSPGTYTFCGRGFGHGLGLSQWGSKALAEQGYNAAQILSYYYKDIVVEPIIDNSGN